MPVVARIRRWDSAVTTLAFVPGPERAPGVPVSDSIQEIVAASGRRINRCKQMPSCATVMH
jgi:hypothetical protein